MRGRLQPWAYLGLAVLAWIVFGQVRHFQFTNFDDPTYIFDNPHTLAGLTWSNVRWAFTTGTISNWHPVTWLSHMADVSLFGLDAGRHHLVNVALHLANGALLFRILYVQTREFGPSLLVAALFLVHPAHVESVAWVAERKDVLSTCLALLTLMAHQARILRPSPWRQALVLGLYALGLMAKPMLVTLPLLMLLLDYWPLGRFTSWGAFRLLVREKAPMFALALLSGVVTMAVQRAGGAMAIQDRVALGIRLGNAAMSSVRYLGMLVWPVNLGPFYPFRPEAVQPWTTALCVAAVVLVTVLAIRFRDRAPWLLVGWLWYLVAILPVIGIIQVGSQALADRYTYVPYIGAFIILAWGGRSVARVLRIPAAARTAVPVLAVGLLTVQARAQTAYWHDNITLWRRALQVAPVGNLVAVNNLGLGLFMEKRLDESIHVYRSALDLDPASYQANFGMGLALNAAGRKEASLVPFQAALRARPGDTSALKAVARTLLELDRLEEAIPFYGQLIDLEQVRRLQDPDSRGPVQVSQEARMALGFILRQLGREGEGAGFFAAAWRADPRDQAAGLNLAISLSALGRGREALEVLRRCVAVNPRQPLPQFHLGLELERMGDRRGAEAAFRRVVELQPGNAEARRRLLSLQGRP